MGWFLGVPGVCQNRWGKYGIVGYPRYIPGTPRMSLIFIPKDINFQKENNYRFAALPLQAFTIKTQNIIHNQVT